MNDIVKGLPQPKPQARLEKWFQAGPRLCGEVYGHPLFGPDRPDLKDGNVVITSTLVSMDEAAGVAETSNTIYKLGPKP